MSAVNDKETSCSCGCAGVRMMGRSWVAGILAAMELVLGFILLGFPFLLGVSAVWVGGFVLAIAGVVRLVQGVIHRENRWWNLLAAVLYLLVGLFTVLMPVLSMEWWTLLIGASLLTAGIMRMAVAVSMWKTPGRFWRCFNALVSLVLGTMVIWSWPESSVWLIGTLIAVEMIFSGWTLMFLAMASPRVATENQ